MDKHAYITHPLLHAIPHGFFTRQGGVSEGEYSSLNCSLRSEDQPENIATNMARIAGVLGVPDNRFARVRQVHGIKVSFVTSARVLSALSETEEADAMVTNEPGIALGVVTADCSPVLFSGQSKNQTIIGAAHAGWRGATGGILEETVKAMEVLGCNISTIKAVIGPCIGVKSYQVKDDMRTQALAADPRLSSFFKTGEENGFYYFDLSGYCQARLKASGVNDIAITGQDTCAMPEHFFSHRRRVLEQRPALGLQMSAIACR